MKNKTDGASNVDVEEVAKQWTELFNTEVLQYAKPNKASDGEVFANIYHSLAHSPLAATMIQLEHQHASAVTSTDELESTSNSEDDWERVCRVSNASHVREIQRREYRQWIETVHEDSSSDAANKDMDGMPVSLGTMSRSDSAFTMSSMSMGGRSESFTITLGAQMKAMHNLRLVAADIFTDICRFPEELEVGLPQRLQTSMSLYSNNLSGLVLLTDDAYMSLEGSKMTNEFNKLCTQSTEFHFPSFDQQLESIRNEHLEPAISWRLDYISRNRFHQEEAGQGDQGPTPPPLDRLKCGDFYVTRHSNLSDVHVVFHMITDESVLQGNIGSRHPVVMGLRNVLKMASMCSVTTLTVPLLLSNTMEEVMTIPWCMKRAELLYKCLKGFLMENSSWGGSEIRTLQFLIPPDVSPDVFSKLSLMLPTIFRTSNPIRAN